MGVHDFGIHNFGRYGLAKSVLRLGVSLSPMNLWTDTPHPFERGAE